MTENQYQETKIKELLYEMSSLFSRIQFEEEASQNNPEDDDIKYAIVAHEDRFKDLARGVFKLCLVYFESKSLNDYSEKFQDVLKPYFETPNKMLSSSYYAEGDEIYSDLCSIYWSYLLPFQFFNDDSYQLLFKNTGIEYLENILESTCFILKEVKVNPTTEKQVYDAVKFVIKTTFPNASFPTQSFQKTAKCYIPDILVPSLSCAVEYKYAETEARLIETIDQILIDVKGYDNNPSYKIFYAVFYVRPGIWTQKRFNEVWKEKDFPPNWKGIFVIGD